MRQAQWCAAGTGFASGGIDRRLLVWQAFIGPDSAKGQPAMTSPPLNHAGTYRESTITEDEAASVADQDDSPDKHEALPESPVPGLGAAVLQRGAEDHAQGSSENDAAGSNRPNPAHGSLQPSADAAAAVSLSEAKQQAFPGAPSSGVQDRHACVI